MQLTEYRAHIRVHPKKPPSHGSHAPTQKQSGFSIDDLADQYDLGDLLDFTRNATSSEQSVDDEYIAYTVASLSEKGTDVLKFWEVSILNVLT